MYAWPAGLVRKFCAHAGPERLLCNGFRNAVTAYRYAVTLLKLLYINRLR